jgi:hypothetical protein
MVTRLADGTIIGDSEVKNGRRGGQGFLTFRDGAKYVGNWADGKPDGQGTLNLADGTSFAGIWHHGCFADGEREAERLAGPGGCP